MNHFPSLLAALAAWLVLGGCAGERAPTSDTARRFSSAINHTYFPLNRGVVRTYAGHVEGVPLREEVRTLDATHQIVGVECTAVQQEVYLAEVLSEVTTEWYAQDTDGNVWKFGEESLLAVDDGQFVRDADSWVAGEEEAHAWIQFPADPRPGHRYTGYAPGQPDVLLIVSTTAAVTVAGGTFADCLEIAENPDDPTDTDIILYAPRVGKVFSSGGDAKSELVSVRGN